MTKPVLRPCWFAGVLWFCVQLLCPFLSDTMRWASLITCLLLAVVFITLRPLRRLHALPMAAITCVLAIVAFQSAYAHQVKIPQQGLGKPQELHVQVIATDSGLTLETESGLQFRYYPIEKDWEIEPYDTFTAAFTLVPYRSRTPFQAAVARADGLWLLAESADEDAMRSSQQAGTAPYSLFSNVRTRLCAAVEQTLQGDVGAIVTGIFLGKDERLSAIAVSDFRVCGVSHLFSVSGLHMAVLVRGVLWLLRQLRVRRLGRALILSLFLLEFMALVGFSPSVVRSGLVCLVATLGDCLRRQADTKNSLGLALLLLLVPQPFAAFDVGLLLSFAATYGLVCWTPTIRHCLTGGFVPNRCRKVWDFVLTSLSVSLAALFATLPITMVFFGRISLMSVPANLLTVLPSEGILIGGCMASVLSAVGLHVLAQPIFFIVGCLSRYLLWICQKISTFSFATVAIRIEFLVLWIIGVYVLFFLGRRWFSYKGQCALLGVCLSIVMIGSLLHRYVTDDQLRVLAIPDTEAAAVMTYHGQTVVIVSPQQANTPYRLRMVLDDAGISYIDVLCLIGGDEPVVSVLPSVLDGYVTSDTCILYTNLPWHSPWKGVSLDNYTVTLGHVLTVKTDDDFLWLGWEPYRLAFTTAPCDTVPETADLLITTSQLSVRVRTPEGEFAVPIGSAVVADNEQWYVEGVEDNADFGAGTQATSENR